MSELKVHKIGDLCFDFKMGKDVGIDFYLKTEADKVITLLKEKANYNEYAYKLKSEELADTCRFYEDELRHHKYKRCMAMAKWSESENNRLEAISPIFDTDKEYWKYNSDYWSKWQERWLKIAEKFNPNSTAQ